MENTDLRLIGIPTENCCSSQHSTQTNFIAASHPQSARYFTLQPYRGSHKHYGPPTSVT
jgi:hypothetical protein